MTSMPLIRRLLLAAAATAVSVAIATPVWLWTHRSETGATAAEEHGRFRFPGGETDLYVRDPVAGHLHVPHAVRRYRWPEHPDGKIRLAANNLGFREDEDTAPKPARGVRRILVTGDSHTDGVVANSESFANVLEKRLGPSFEVINGGVGYYGPFNYHGFLLRYESLEPSTFVVVAYTGNDFLDAIRTGSLRELVEVPTRPKAYNARLQAAAEIDQAAVGQFFNSLFFFATFPALQERAVDLAAGELEAIADICRQQHIDLRLLLLPSKFEHELHQPWQDRTKVDRLLAALHLTPEDLGIHRRMAAALTAELTRSGTQVVDLLPILRRHSERLFWDTDAHLSVRGHQVVADVLHDLLTGTPKETR